MFKKPAASKTYASAEDRVPSVTPPYQADEKDHTQDEAKFVGGDYVLETGHETGANSSAQMLWTDSARKTWHPSAAVTRESSAALYEYKSSRRYWKPITLQYPMLFSFVTISLSLIAILEVLHHFSNGDSGGGLSFGATVNDLSAMASFSYLYLPTVLAVMYSMLWNWIDLDAKRLEPWFQLSRNNGATAADSLLLHYPFEFLAFAPIRALRRRHWAVFYAGFITMVIFWVITPLQSAIFTTGIVFRKRHIQMTATGSVLPVDSQIAALNANFMNTAYGVAWLGQKMPAYSTAEYILRPYAPLNSDTDALSTGTWTASTVGFGTKLDCKPASISFDNASVAYIFDNGAGCTTQELAIPRTELNSTFMALYIPFWDNAEDDWALRGPNCSFDQSRNFLALAASAASAVPGIQSGQYNNLTALFCQPSYFEVEVNAEINATDHSVVSSNFSSDSSKTKILPDNFFNITNFEYIIGTGISPISIRQDYQNTRVLEQYPRISQYGLTWPVSNMVGFAVAANAASNNTVEDLLNPLVLQAAFEKAHQLLFSTAISTLTQLSTSNETWEGLLTDQPAAIVFVRGFSIVVEASLALVALLTCALWYFSYCRPSRLLSDPAASISDVMSLVRNSKEFSHLFQDDGTVTAEMLENRIGKTRFSLGLSESGIDIKLCVHSTIPTTNNGEKEGRVSKTISDLSKMGKFKPVRPREMSLATGFAVIVFIIGAIGLLIYFNIRINENNGIALPSENTLLLSFLENALPTAFPSILEPLWVVLNRLLCLLQPLEDLRKGNSRPSRTIRVQYTSLPPQLVFWRALRSQHLILAIVCAVAISSNVLAVTLSNLFNEAPTAVETTIVLPQTYDASIIGDKQITSGNTSRPIVYTDHFYVAMSNLTNGTSLPPWIDNSFFYLPFEIPSNSAQSNFVLSQGASQLQGFLGTTRGFGAETTCQPLLQNAPNNSLIFNPSDNGSTIQFFTQHILPDSANITCISGDQGNLTFLMPGLVPDSAAAVEVVSLMSNSSVDDGGFCKKFLVLGWVRIGPQDINADLATTNGTNGRSFESVFMSCSQHILTAEFNVTVDSTGHILSAQQSGPFDEPESFITTNSTVHLIDQLNNLNTPVPFFGNLWHNDSYTSDWMNSILKAYINSGKLVDPQSLLPDINATIPIVQDVYQRLAAIIIGLNTQIFTPATTDAAVNTTVTLISTRIFMSPLMFQISTTLLGIHLLTAILYYVYRPKRFLPRMPDTIASLIGYISMSHALDTLPHKEEKHPPSRPIADTKRYGFGRFIGVDGKPHVGIEEQYRVIPLQSTNPAVRRRRWDLKAWWQERKMPQTWI